MGGGIKPNFDDWKNVASLKAWELAALMKSVDPRALADAVDGDFDEYGGVYIRPLDLSWNVRLINGAVQAGLIQSPYPYAANSGDETTVIVSSLGHWLVNQGHGALASSLGLVTPAAATQQTAPHASQQKPLATRSELISVFGSFTGLCDAWFNSLKDKPALKHARKQVGVGQRGNTTEPLFCPYEVMLWLIDPKRRTGRQLGKDKGWELLEKHFSSSYNQNSVADPRNST